MGEAPIKSKFSIRPAGGRYQYYIDYTANLNPIIHLIAGLSPDKTYYWNIPAIGNKTTIINSPWANSENDWMFRTSSAITLPAPALQAPKSGSTGVPFDIDLVWSNDNALPAEVLRWVRFKPAGGLYTSTNVDPHFSTLLKTGLAPGKTSFWNFQAIGDGTGILNSAWTNGGADWSFTTSPPVTLNPPVLLAPADGATINP